ncbi:MAG: hypothetical protein FJX62_21180 [Alphaproteobacteria bacterium]|nr:hypothetical protein [Alphaproteobacteria bacterium]
MRTHRGPLPLAFILAMAAESATAVLPDDAAETRRYNSGDLRKLLDRAADENLIGKPADQSGDRLLPGDKTAQFFPNFPNFPNFFNCFNGYWRNC